MGKKLDALLGRKFKTSKFKATVNLAVSRLSVLKNQRKARLAVARSDVVQLLNLNHHEHALLRVDQVIREQNLLDAYEMMDGFCRLLVERVNLIEQERDCPDELQEAASSLLFAAPRCGEFPELQEIRAILTARFGKEFANRAIELRNNCGVSHKMIQKLSPRQSNLESRMKMLREIATENGIVLQLEEVSPVIKEEKVVVVEQKQNQPKLEPEVVTVAAATKLLDDFTDLPREVEEALSFSESVKGRKKYRDVADAAQAAFESAAYAAAAARAAVELSRSESFDSDNQDSPGSQPRKAVNPMKSKLNEGEDKGSRLQGYGKSRSPKYDSESEDEANEVEGSKYNMKGEVLNSSDSDGSSDEGTIRSSNLGQTKPLGNKMVFDESDHEDHNISGGHNDNAYDISYKQSPFRHQATAKAELGLGNPRTYFGEGSKMQEVQQLNLEKRPISVRTKRVYGR